MFLSQSAAYSTGTASSCLVLCLCVCVRARAEAACDGGHCVVDGRVPFECVVSVLCLYIVSIQRNVCVSKDLFGVRVYLYDRFQIIHYYSTI